MKKKVPFSNSLVYDSDQHKIEYHFDRNMTTIAKKY